MMAKKKKKKKKEKKRKRVERLRMKENQWEGRKERKENDTQYIFHVCCFYKYYVNYCPWWGRLNLTYRLVRHTMLVLITSAEQ